MGARQAEYCPTLARADQTGDADAPTTLHEAICTPPGIQAPGG